MTRLGWQLAALAALLVPLAGAAQDRPPFEATGEIRFHGYGTVGTSAAYDGERLIGPTVNLTRREDGTWGGDLAGQNMDLEVTDRRISGPNVSLNISQKDGRTEVEGLFFNQRFRVSLDAKRLRGRFGECSFDMERKRGRYQGDVGCVRPRAAFPSSAKATLSLIGTAGDAAPPLPQLALALVAILPS
jgi:hypothetical protein